MRNKLIVLVVALTVLFVVRRVMTQETELLRDPKQAAEETRVNDAPTAAARTCVECHSKTSPGTVEHWKGSAHAQQGIECIDCHQADAADADAFEHYGETIATIVTPRDCSNCHDSEYEEFTRSHHAKAGNILFSLDNLLAETVEGSRTPFNPHSPTLGIDVTQVNGMASVNVGCKQCHGSKIALESVDGTLVTVDQLKPDEDDQPTNRAVVATVKRDETGRPGLHTSTWPNTGIGRINLDGSLGSCSACHSRHDFSPRRARQPENCGKCHLGPDHPQKEVYEESKHGVCYRDLKDEMNLDAEQWVLGKDYSQASTCATCHMSGHSRNGGRVTHDAGERISWTNRPPVSLLLDTDEHGELIKEANAEKRAALIKDTWQNKRGRMQQVGLHCHTQNYVDGFYRQYDDFVINYNEKFAKPGQQIITALRENKVITDKQFDDEIEWTWFDLWHHEGRRARHGASMMAPDYAHWHGMYEVAERFYQELIPQARKAATHAENQGRPKEAARVRQTIEGILNRPEHRWFEAQVASELR
ncbi:MAG: multiheme c-type cytochrome [Planctomycetota bacterium]|nr:multiheme c-type cytochrome [Planctomycetota bacterium]